MSTVFDEHRSSLPASLQEAQIPDFPPSAYYIPNFITSAEESALLDKVISFIAPSATLLSPLASRLC